MRVWVVLPAYNEEENLPAIMQGFQELVDETYKLDLEILVVNDGSTDRTATIALESAGTLAVTVIDNERNMGLSETFIHGITEATQRANGSDIILCMDADNSHLPGLAARMIRAVREGRDVVIASRYQPGAVVRGVPFSRQLLSYGMSILFRLVYPIQNVKDYSCGYRAYRAGFLQQALKSKGRELFVGEGFSCMAGILLRLGRLGAICGEVPIILRYDNKGGGSKMKVVKTVISTLKMLFQERFRQE